MTMFIDAKVQLPGAAPVLCTAWSKSSPALFAAGDNDGNVSITDSQGNAFVPRGSKAAAVKSRSVSPTALCFRPTSPYELVIGWKDGTVTCWHVTSGMERSEDSLVHDEPILHCEWTTDGNHVFICDVKGKVSVWSIDRKSNKLVMEHKWMKPKTIISSACLVSPNSDGAGRIAVGCEGGAVIMFCADGTEKDLFALDASVHGLLWHTGKAKNRLVAVARNMALAVYSLDAEGNTTAITHGMRLGATLRPGERVSILWIGAGMMATATGESMLRVFNVLDDDADNYIISLADYAAAVGGNDQGEGIVHCSYSSTKRILAAATNSGRVLLWRSRQEVAVEAEQWVPIPPLQLDSRSLVMDWGPVGTLSIAQQSGASFVEQILVGSKCVEGTCVTQMSSAEVVVERVGGVAATLKPGSNVRGCTCSDDVAVVWTGTQIWAYDVGPSSVSERCTINRSVRALAVYTQRIYVSGGETGGVLQLAKDGSVEAQIECDPNDGDIIAMDCGGKFLVAVTDQNTITVWNVGLREPKRIFCRKRFGEGELIRVNSVRICPKNGSRLSFITEKSQDGQSWEPDHRLHVYNVDEDSFQTFTRGPMTEILSHCWDSNEPRLLGLHVRRRVEDTNGGTSILGEPEDEVLTCFATADSGILVQDVFPLGEKLSGLCGLQVPFVIVQRRPDKPGGPPRATKRTMRDFEGIDASDENIRNALLEFSFLLTKGHVDEAFKAVKAFNSEAVWRSMAVMAVKTHRLDVAEVCLGNMNNALGVRAIREARKEPEIEAQVAAAAVYLGMMDDAERLYRECSRHDLLAKMLAAKGDFDRAVEIAAKKDRMHIRTIEFQKAKHLEAIGHIDGALKSYEAAGAHRKEVPRMLMESKRISDLEAYCKESGDSKLVRWWARYCESSNRLEEALSLYDAHKDFLGKVQVLWAMGDTEQAKQVVLDSSSAEAAYYVAQKLEAEGDLAGAIDMFGRAGKFGHAVRVAKREGMDNQLLSLALQAPKNVQVDAASYFAEHDQVENAVLLYRKGGHIRRAMELCYRAKLFDALQGVAEDIAANSSGGIDPDTLNTAARFFLENGQFDKASKLYIGAKEYEKGLTLCEQHNVKLSEEMAEQITAALPSKTENAQLRSRVLLVIASTAEKQGSFHLATKKYTQAGEKEKAMKCLLKSGDTERIIFFANTLRSAKIYVMAANFLQTLNWHSDADVMKAIIQFYTKAKSWDSLSLFYDACAQVEIDEYRDYDKALGALKEAHKYATQSQTAEGARREAELGQRIRQVETFVHARAMHQEAPDEMLRVCNELLNTPDVEGAVRTGDVFALLIEWHYAQREMDKAYSLVQRMQQRRIMLDPFLDGAMIRDIQAAVGVNQSQSDFGFDGELDEEVEDVY